MPRCFVHIGSEKTGTTSIQRYFGRNRDSLREQGFWYPRSCASPKADVHRPLSDAALGDELGPHGELARAFETEFRQELQSGVHTAIFSSEFFHSRVRSTEPAERLKEFLSRYFDSIRIVFYARRQDHLAVSMHSTAVRSGKSAATRAIEIYERKQHHYFDHLGVANLWAGVFGDANLVCRIYERPRLANGDVIDDIAAIIGLPPDDNRRRVKANESLSYVCMNLLLRLKKSRHRDNDLLRRAILQTDRDLELPRLPFMTKREAQEFMARFAESNREFFATRVSPDLAKDFDDSFGKFPDDLLEPTAQEMLEFLFALDQHR